MAEIAYILASGSPRRRELLTQMGLTYRVLPATGEEKISTTIPSEVTELLSLQKASEVFGRLWDRDGDLQKEYADYKKVVVIGADTVVSYKGRILGKPKDREDARATIRMLQGDVHQVVTGVTLIWKDAAGTMQTCSFHETTDVQVVTMTDAEIDAYIASGEADDKAGSYGIQGAFGKYILEIHGDYFNVVGLPIARLYAKLKELELIG